MDDSESSLTSFHFVCRCVVAEATVGQCRCVTCVNFSDPGFCLLIGLAVLGFACLIILFWAVVVARL